MRRKHHVVDGKALSDIPALKPCWGNPPYGFSGISRRPVRATALPGNPRL
jgi:hypothetical protein